MKYINRSFLFSLYRRGRSVAHRYWKIPFVAVSVCLFFVVLCDLYVGAAGRGRIYSRPEDVPNKEIALVPGTGRILDGKPNRFYWARLEGAAKLFELGKVRGLLVSGDNGQVSYNEPDRMKSDLVKMGVPAEFITCDYAGFSTLDSVHRTEKVFQERDYVFVSQGFHVSRALFIGDDLGHNAMGLKVDSPSGYWKYRIRARDVLARVKAVIEVKILRSGPKFLGKKETVGKR